jgi:hypothetical protein
MIDPSILAALAPRLRRLAQELDALPGPDRQAHLERWCATQPDGAEILAAVGRVDPEGPLPRGTGFRAFREN